MRSDDRDGEDFGEEPGGAGFDPRMLLDFVRRRKLIFLLVSIPLLLPASIAPFLLDSFYEATATVAIRTTPKVMEFGADFMPGSASGDPRRASGPSDAALLTVVYSDAVLGRVVDQLPAGGEQRAPGMMDRARAALGRGGDVALTPDQQRAAKIEVMRRIITATLSGGGSFLRITSVGGSPGTATFLANAIADAYVKYEEDQREGASRRAVAWLNQQVYELREQARNKEQALTELIASNNLSPASLREQEESDETPAEQVEMELQETRINLLATQERLASLSPRAAVSTGNSEDDQARASLREQYNGALTELESARLRFTPTHPEVRRLEGVVQSLASRLGADPGGRRGMLTPAEETEYQTLRSEESRLRARVSVLERTRNDMVVATGPKSDAISRYKRLEKELAVDKKMLDVLLTRRNETMLTAATHEVGAQILDYAVAPSSPAGPNRMKYLIAGYGFALLAGLGVALLLELIDRRIRDPEVVASLLGTSSLGMVPMVENKKVQPERQAVDAPGSAAGESYRNVRTSLLFAMRTAKLHCLLISSAVAGEGKTTTCVNLAGAFARMGRRVVLVDADLRRPRVHRVFRLEGTPGLSDVLQGRVALRAAIVRPERTEFDLLPAGAMAENPSELLGSTAFAQVMADLKSEYDLVMLDSAVLLAVPDALVLAAEADGVLLVHKPGSVDRSALRRIREDLSRAGARVLGVVFNQIDPASSLHYPTYMYSPYVKHEDGSRSKFKRGS